MAQSSTSVQQVTCPDCKGSGLLKVTVYRTPAGRPVTCNSPVSYNETCLNCNGTGSVAR